MILTLTTADEGDSQTLVVDGSEAKSQTSITADEETATYLCGVFFFTRTRIATTLYIQTVSYSAGPTAIKLCSSLVPRLSLHLITLPG